MIPQITHNVSPCAFTFPCAHPADYTCRPEPVSSSSSHAERAFDIMVLLFAMFHPSRLYVRQLFQCVSVLTFQRFASGRIVWKRQLIHSPFSILHSASQPFLNYAIRTTCIFFFLTSHFMLLTFSSIILYINRICENLRNLRIQPVARDEARTEREDENPRFQPAINDRRSPWRVTGERRKEVK